MAFASLRKPSAARLTSWVKEKMLSGFSASSAMDGTTAFVWESPTNISLPVAVTLYAVVIKHLHMTLCKTFLIMLYAVMK